MIMMERVFPSLDTAAEAMAGTLADLLRGAIAARGRAGLAVSGGRTPTIVLPALARAELPWGQVRVTLTDERWVPPGHPDSNEFSTRKYLLRGPAAAAEFTGLVNAAATPEAGYPETERKLALFPLPLDAVFLGMGEDGHIASIFPHQKEVGAGGLCVASRAPSPPHARISLTLPLLMSSRHAVLMVNGPAKRAVYEDAKATPPGEHEEFPLRLLLHQRPMPITVFLVAPQVD